VRPAPIPDDVAERTPGVRFVIGPPGNDLDCGIPPVEAMIERLPSGVALSARCVLEDGDLDKLAAGGAVWVTFLGKMVPFAVTVGE
jgi:hypothetical protein